MDDENPGAGCVWGVLLGAVVWLAVGLAVIWLT